MDYQSVKKDAQQRMDKALGIFKDKLKGMRTGRATPALVEEIRIEYYGSPTPLKQLAHITAPEADQIVIKPFDASAVDAVQKGILKSDLGITPQTDGKIVRLTIPPLSLERRKQLAGAAKEAGEECRVAVRNIRRDANKHADQLEKDVGLSEDDVKALKEEVQGFVKDFEKKIDELLKKKTDELTTL
jgi:ribosome recycling factor